MAKDASFDIVSQIDMQEVDNAINQALREIETRFDFKNSKSDIKHESDKLTLISDDEFKLKNVVDILETKFVKRNLSLKALQYGKIESAAGDTVRQVVTLQQGIDKDQAKKIIKMIKDSKLRVQAQIQDDQVRVSGKNRDDLQEIIKIIREADLEFDVQFSNYR